MVLEVIKSRVQGCKYLKTLHCCILLFLKLIPHVAPRVPIVTAIGVTTPPTAGKAVMSDYLPETAPKADQPKHPTGCIFLLCQLYIKPQELPLTHSLLGESQHRIRLHAYTAGRETRTPRLTVLLQGYFGLFWECNKFKKWR